MNFLKAKRNFRCIDCNYCNEAVCPSTDECIGCGACFIACPYNAVDMVKSQATAKIKINIDGKEACVPKKITVKKVSFFFSFKIWKQWFDKIEYK